MVKTIKQTMVLILVIFVGYALFVLPDRFNILYLLLFMPFVFLMSKILRKISTEGKNKE